MADQVLVNIDLSGTDFNDSVYYLSKDAYVGSNFYFPFLLSAPKISIGDPRKSYLKTEIGSLVITNEPTNSDHPFYGSRYNTLLSKQLLIPFEVRIEESTNPLFAGSLFLTRITQEELSFDIYDEAASLQSVDLLTKVLRGDDGYLISSIEDNSSRLRITTSTSHTLSDGNQVIFQNMQTIAHELEYTKASDNYYVIDYVSDTVFDLVDKNGTDVDPTTFELLDDTTTGTTTITKSGELVGTYTVADALTIVIDDDVTIEVVDTNTSRTGIPNARPFVFGRVEHVVPVFWFNEANNEVINPEMDVSINNTDAPIENVFLQVFEDGQEVATAEDGDSKEFTTAATADVLTLNATATGELSISGVSSNGTSILDFYENVIGDRLQYAGNPITVNIDKAPRAASIVAGFEIYAASVTASVTSPEDPVTTGDLYINRDTVIDSPFTVSDGDTVFIGDGYTLTIEEQVDPSIQPAFINALAFYETKQQSLLGFADKVGRFCNYQFYIKNDILYLIDRSNTPSTSTIFEEFEILNVEIENQGPIRAINGSWQIREPKGSAIVAGSEPTQGYPQLVSREITTGVPLLGTGQDISEEVFHQDEPEVRSYMSNVLFIDQRPIASIIVSGIKDDIEMGDRVKFNRKAEFLSVDFLVRQIDYDFENYTTLLKGDCYNLTQYELDKDFGTA